MPIAAIIMVWMLKLTQKRDPLKFILKYTIYAFVLQAIIAFLALFIPAVKDFLVSVMAANTGASVFNNTYEVSRRFYGFSNSMLDSFGYATGLATILTAVYALLYKKYIYLLIVPALGVVGLLNSRTAIIITAIGIIVAVPFIATVAYNRARLKDLKLKVNSKHTAVAAVVIVALTATILTIDAVSPATLTSTKTSLDRTARTLTGDATDNPLFKPSFWELPEKPEVIIIGSGHTVFEARGYKHSDVGYINDIWSFGVIGSILLYLSILALFVPAIRNSTKTEMFIIIFLIVALFIFQIKARAFVANPGFLMTLMIGMAINLRIHSRLKHEDKNE